MNNQQVSYKNWSLSESILNVYYYSTSTFWGIVTEAYMYFYQTPTHPPFNLIFFCLFTIFYCLVDPLPSLFALKIGSRCYASLLLLHHVLILIKQLNVNMYCTCTRINDTALAVPVTMRYVPIKKP